MTQGQIEKRHKEDCEVHYLALIFDQFEDLLNMSTIRDMRND